MKCIVHIGAEKTGTTALQRWLSMKSTGRVLGKQGVYVSDLAGNHSGREIAAYCQSHLDDWAMRKRIFSASEKEAYFQGFPGRLEEDARKAAQSHGAYLISSEHFHSRLRRPEELIRLREFLAPLFDEVRIVAYFREPSQTALSFYSTYVIGDGTRTLDEFLSHVTPGNYYYNCKDIADNWSQVFGPESCHFRIYDKDFFGEHDLRGDFVTALGLPASLATQTGELPRWNESLSGLQADLIRLTNELWPLRNAEGDGVNSTNLKVKALLRSMDALRKGPITSPHLEGVSERFREVNQRFFDSYFGGKYLFRHPSPTGETAAQETFTLDEVRDLLMGAMTQAWSSVPSRFSAIHD